MAIDFEMSATKLLKDTPHRRRCELEHVREDLDCEYKGNAAVEFARHDIRPEIAQSWERSLRSVEPTRRDAPTAEECTPARWADSPLRRPIDELAGDLKQIVDAGFVVGISDHAGTLLWTYGGRVMRRRAERVNFAPGGRWGESTIGTNAIALTLDTGSPSTVWSAEHFVETLHDWVCYSAPIRNPRGELLGVLDFSTTCDRANPLAVATVKAMARTIEARLREPQPVGPHQSTAANVAFRCLGRTELTIDGSPVQVSPRQAEILALLRLRPDGYTPAELSLELYGDRDVSMSTLKSEVSRLRRTMGGGIAAHRYMLTTSVRCDAVEVLGHLTAGDVLAAVNRYRGPVLPASESPGVVEWRNRIEVAIREAALRSGDPGPAILLGERIEHDPALFEHAVNLMTPHDSRLPLIAGRLHVLRQSPE